MDTGTRLGQYEILGPLGVGGMGEVYRARDSKLGRDVAIKVLPAPVAGDPERLARLAREAQVLAALNHPNIATIYGLEDDGEVAFLAMELAAGEDLAQVLMAGPLPWPEARAIALQIGAALGAAHDRGIVHRDLKPANVMVSDEGAVKVLDFGLAKAVALGAASGGVGGELTASPTVLGQTGTGVILGTAAYMSPEQARGKPVDRRTDIWAYGCLLYELLTGDRPFCGESLTDVLAAIVKDEPDLDSLPHDVPGEVRTLIARCLRKDPAERLRDAGDAALLLREATETDSFGAAPSTERGGSGLTRAVAAGAAFGVVAVLAWLAFGNSNDVIPAGAQSELRLSIPLPDGTQLYTVDSAAQQLAVSPDGRLIVWAGVGKDGRRLYRRALDDAGAQTIPGTEGAVGPFFSPDGRWIGFYAGNTLQKVGVDGGLPVRITESIAFYGASWDESQRIVYAPTPDSGIWWVDADGGVGEPVPGWNKDGRLIAAQAPVPVAGDPDSIVFTGISQALGTALYRYSWSTGRVEHLLDRPLALLGSKSQLFSLDDDGLLEVTGTADGTITGSPQPVLAGVRQFAASRSGTVATVRDPTLTRLTQMTRGGAVVGRSSEPRRYAEIARSPGGERVALRVPNGAAAGIWLAGLDRAGMAHTVRLPVLNGPTWAPDGSSILLFGTGGMSRYFLDGSETEVLIGFGELFEEVHVLSPGTWSADGWLVFESISAGRGPRIWALNLDDRDAGPLPLLPDPAGEFRPARSPDGSWLAYESVVGGRRNIYLRPFLQPGVPIQVSSDGGDRPRWTRGGTELIFRVSDELFAVTISADAAGRIQVGTPEPLFQMPGLVDYDVSADGETFYALESVYPRLDRIDLILNFGQFDPSP